MSTFAFVEQTGEDGQVSIEFDRDDLASADVTLSAAEAARLHRTLGGLVDADPLVDALWKVAEAADALRGGPGAATVALTAALAHLDDLVLGSLR